MKTVGVIQSSYIPWKGYFDLISDVDLFVFLDDVQFTKADWRNRNAIKTPSGTRWMTIPVGARQNRLIHEVALPDRHWAMKHWTLLKVNYSGAPFFKQYVPLLDDIYLGEEHSNLSAFNQYVITRIARECLGITTEFVDSRELGAVGHKQDRLLDLLAKARADVYVSGPAARVYIDEDRFEEAGIRLVWKDYGNYPVYQQLHPPFTHHVTILDLLFHVGPAAPDYIWGWRSHEAGVAPPSLRDARSASVEPEKSTR